MNTATVLLMALVRDLVGQVGSSKAEQALATALRTLSPQCNPLALAEVVRSATTEKRR